MDESNVVPKTQPYPRHIRIQDTRIKDTTDELYCNLYISSYKKSLSFMEDATSSSRVNRWCLIKNTLSQTVCVESKGMWAEQDRIFVYLPSKE